jgi:hypothetical protein
MLRSLRNLTLTLCAACACAPSTSFAGLFDWFHRDACCDPCAGGVTTFRYRPLFPRLGLFRSAYYAPAATACCSPCATPCCDPCQTVQYVPQTTYRPYVVNVPVTTCQCVQACDPCTGCPVTVRRPVTTYVQQVRYAPCTTYRPVCPTPCPSPCGATESYLPNTTTVVPGYAPSATFAPSTTVVPGYAPSYAPGTTIVPSTTVDPGAPGITVPATPSPPSTFREGSSSNFRPAVPFNGFNGNYNTNHRSEPSRQAAPAADRTTSVPQRSWTFRPVSSETQAKILPAKQTSENRDGDDAWRAAKR